MMKTRGFVLALLALAVSWTVVVATTRSQDQEDFIIDGADAVTTRATGISLTLPVPLEPRFIVEWADTMATVEVSEVPPDFPLALQPRFIVDWLDRMVSREVAPIPPDMPKVLQPRFILQWADAAQKRQLVYPCELVSDEAPPVISLSDPEVEGDSVTVTWQTNEYADSLLEYGLAPGSYSETVYDPWYAKSHEFMLSGLEPDTTYYCRVTSTDRCGNAASSNCGWHTTGPPSPPSNLQATTVSASQIDITWEDNSSAETEFRIERSPDPACISGWMEIGSVPANATAYSDAGLSCSSEPYCYRARAYRQSDDAYSVYSNIDSAATKPCAPSDLSAEAVSTTEIALTWQDNSSDETFFYIEQSLDGIANWRTVESVPADTTQYTVTGLSCWTTYYYQVCAFRLADKEPSPYSNMSDARTLECYKIYLPVVIRNSNQ